MDSPVIIGGVERSGTSLLRAILGSHPDLAIFQWDLPLWRKFYNEFGNRNMSFDECKELLQKIASHRKALKAEMTPDTENVLHVLRRKKKPLKCEQVFGAYLQAYAKKQGRERWGLKTPTNEFYANSIFKEFPKATLIHVIRDPRDVIVSMMKTSFMNKLSLSVYPHKFKGVKTLDRWYKSSKVALKNKNRFGKKYQIVRYEDVVKSTNKSVKLICKVSELKYKKVCLT